MDIKKQLGFKDEFNRLYRRGSKIAYLVDNKYTELTTECEAFMIHGQAAVYFEEIEGIHSVETKFYKL